jgi:hypothetical protein
LDPLWREGFEGDTALPHPTPSLEGNQWTHQPEAQAMGGVLLAPIVTWEAQIRRIVVPDQPGQKKFASLYFNRKKLSVVVTCLSSQP